MTFMSAEDSADRMIFKYPPAHTWVSGFCAGLEVGFSDICDGFDVHTLWKRFVMSCRLSSVWEWLLALIFPKLSNLPFGAQTVVARRRENKVSNTSIHFLRRTSRGLNDSLFASLSPSFLDSLFDSP